MILYGSRERKMRDWRRGLTGENVKTERASMILGCCSLILNGVINYFFHPHCLSLGTLTADRELVKYRLLSYGKLSALFSQGGKLGMGFDGFLFACHHQRVLWVTLLGLVSCTPKG